MDHHWLLVLLPIWIVALVSPGPDALLVAQTAASAGRRDGFACAAGIGAGMAVWSAAALCGLATLFAEAAWLYRLVVLAGAAYLVVTGLRMLAAARRGDGHGTEEPGIDALHPGAFVAFRRGLLTNLSNPKAAVLFASVFAVTLPPHTGLGLGTSLVRRRGLLLGAVVRPAGAAAFGRTGAGRLPAGGARRDRGRRGLLRGLRCRPRLAGSALRCAAAAQFRARAPRRRSLSAHLADTAGMNQVVAGIDFAPVLPLWLLVALGALAAIALVPAFWRRARGAGLRARGVRAAAARPRQSALRRGDARNPARHRAAAGGPQRQRAHRRPRGADRSGAAGDRGAGGPPAGAGTPHRRGAGGRQPGHPPVLRAGAGAGGCAARPPRRRHRPHRRPGARRAGYGPDRRAVPRPAARPPGRDRPSAPAGRGAGLRHRRTRRRAARGRGGPRRVRTHRARPGFPSAATAVPRASRASRSAASTASPCRSSAAARRWWRSPPSRGRAR